MPGSFANTFTQALQQFEASGDPEPLVALFADAAELSNLAHKAPEKGKDGARRFWQAYRGSFERIASTFTHILESGPAVVLEWTSEGELADGRPVKYDGVSVLEVDAGAVHRFRAYYDSVALAAPAAGEAK